MSDNATMVWLAALFLGGLVAVMGIVARVVVQWAPAARRQGQDRPREPKL
ncbi:hypothetical protein [Streptomyces sp. TR02-1]